MSSEIRIFDFDSSSLLSSSTKVHETRDEEMMYFRQYGVY